MDKIAEDRFEQMDILRVENDSGEIEVHYPTFYEGLPDEYKLVAQRELGETDASKEKGLRKLREFMKKENLSATDDILLSVLRSCKFKIKKSESKLKRYLSFRQEIIGKMCAVDMEKIELILEDAIFTVLPYRDKLGRVVITTRPSIRFELYSMEDLEAVTMCLILFLLTFPLSTVCGLSYIPECKNDSLLIYYPIMKSFRYTFLKHVLDAPLRYGRIDVMNENVLVRIFCNFLKLVLTEKLTKRIHLHGSSYKSLQNFYHPDILTKELGGNSERIHDIMVHKFLRYLRELREKHQKSDV